MTEALAKKETVKSLLALAGYKQRFSELMRERAPQFMASLAALAASNRNLSQCDPKSVVASAFIAATLDLPIEPNLGFAHIVPYKERAQFQIGWRGYVQLALRTGQYKRLSVFPVNAAAFKGFDEFAEAAIDFTKWDDTEPAVGYCLIFELVNGFKKSVFWTDKKIRSHAERYSQAYKKKKTDSPWFTHYPEMALKTVCSNGLRQFGILSAQMREAIKADQAVYADVDAEPAYIDNPETSLKPPMPVVVPPGETTDAQVVQEVATGNEKAASVVKGHLEGLGGGDER